MPWWWSSICCIVSDMDKKKRHSVANGTIGPRKKTSKREKKPNKQKIASEKTNMDQVFFSFFGSYFP